MRFASFFCHSVTREVRCGTMPMSIQEYVEHENVCKRFHSLHIVVIDGWSSLSMHFKYDELNTAFGGWK